MRTKILLVDDEPLFVEIVSRALGKNDYDVTVAGNGPDALARFVEHEFDLVICDRVLPNMSGDEIGAEIKSLQPSIPILLISGGSGMGYDTEVFAGFCRKPFLLKTLLEAIECALGYPAEHALQVSR